jgi:hypothetical protein
MNIRRTVSISCLGLAALVFVTTAFKGEKDPLHKRVFTLGVVEVKDGVPSKKSIADEMEFKDGKLFSDFLKNKFGYKWIKYRINKDSIFTDSADVEIRHFEVEATTTDASNTTLAVNLIIENWDIEGFYKLTKNDKPKKYFDLTGFEKGGKPKKVKKPKEKKPEETGTGTEPKKD